MNFENIVEQNMDVEYKPIVPVTKRTRKENSKRLIIGSIRLNSGKYRTDRERRRFIRKAWKIALK